MLLKFSLKSGSKGILKPRRNPADKMVKRKFERLNVEVPIKTVIKEKTGIKDVKLAGLPRLERRRSLRCRVECAHSSASNVKENRFSEKENKLILQLDNAKLEHDNSSDRRVLRSFAQKINSSSAVGGQIVKPANNNTLKRSKPLEISVTTRSLTDSNRDCSAHPNAFKMPHPKQQTFKSQPFSSTPMKSYCVNSDPFGQTSCTIPKLVLSPINAAMKCSKRVASREETVTLRSRNPKKDENVKDDCHTFSKMRPNPQLKVPMSKHAEAKTGRKLQCDDEKTKLFDSICKYSRTPKKKCNYLSSESDSVDSGSGEYDPLKLFILHDPITTDDMPDPRSSKFRSCELHVEHDDDPDFPNKSKKPTKVKRDAPKCHDAFYESKVNDWLQEIHDKNAEFKEIEDLDLYVE